MGAYIDKKVDNFNRTESESYLQSIIAPASEDILFYFKKGMHMVCQFSNGMACPPATSEAGASRPKSLAETIF
jgi:hypothetical protein